jgi:hypothetical protein
VNTWINRGLFGNYRAAINLSPLNHPFQASRKTANNSNDPPKAQRHGGGKGFGEIKLKGRATLSFFLREKKLRCSQNKEKKLKKQTTAAQHITDK